MDNIKDLERILLDSHIAITEKAKQALVIALGLSTSLSDCDEAFIAAGLRHSNTLLAVLQDRHKLDFTTADNENLNFKDSRDKDIYFDELKRQINGNRPNFKSKDDYEIINEQMNGYDYDGGGFYFGEGSGEGNGDDLDHSGSEGEPDEETLYRLQNGPSEVLSRAISRSLTEGRKIVETFDLLEAAADLPLLEEVFRKGKLSHKTLRSEIGRYRTLEPYGERQQVSLTIENGRIEIRTFGLLDGVIYNDKKISEKNLIVNISGPSPFVLNEVIREFEDLLSSRDLSELDIQRFLEEHPGLLLGDSYSALRSHLILDRGDRGPLIPDFFAELHNEKYFDIIDLKKPDEQLIVGSKNRRGFSAAVYTAVNQLRLYRDYFDDPRRRKTFHERYGLKGWKPKIAVIIGRTPRGEAFSELITARRSLFDAEVLTYDDIIEKAKRRSININNIKNNKQK